MTTATKKTQAEPAYPLHDLEWIMTMSSNDWAAAKDFSILYGIVVGWDGPAMRELASKYGWNEKYVKRLRKTRRAFRKLQLKEETNRRRWLKRSRA